MELNGKKVLITGASSGFGRLLALELAKRGNDVVVTARREQLLQDLAKEIESLGARCVVYAADATDPVQSMSVIETAIKEFERIDVAILNAGGGIATNMATASASKVLKIMRMNYDTLVNFLCPMIEHMQPHGGVIAYTGSPAGFIGLPKSGPYSAAKAAGKTLFDACRIELAKTKIRLVAMYPGFAYTDGLDPKDVPVKSLIISKERAVNEMITAIEAEKSHHLFPKRIKLLMTVARSLPEPIRRRILALGA